MERRNFILGMGSFFVGACASRTGLSRPQDTAAQPTGSPDGSIAGAVPAPPPPPAWPSRRVVQAPPTGSSAAQPASVVCRAGGAHYTTRPGDTVASISRKYGVAQADICRANPRAVRGRHVEPGRMIWLPGADPARCRPDVRIASTPTRVASPGARPVRGTATPAVRIVRRRVWGAQSLKSNHDPMARIRRITLHHTDEVPGIRARGDREIVSAIQRYHRNHLGWADIGYHYLIGRDGLIYEGRPANIQGAHSGGANNIENLGIAMIGNFSRELPNAAQMRTLEAFLDDRRRAHAVAGRKLHGHRDLGATECPGTTLYTWLQQYKRSC